MIALRTREWRSQLATIRPARPLVNNYMYLARFNERYNKNIIPVLELLI